jgi:aminoglycoside phosphotransferase
VGTGVLHAYGVREIDHARVEFYQLLDELF